MRGSSRPLTLAEQSDCRTRTMKRKQCLARNSSRHSNKCLTLSLHLLHGPIPYHSQIHILPSALLQSIALQGGSMILRIHHRLPNAPCQRMLLSSHLTPPHRIHLLRRHQSGALVILQTVPVPTRSSTASHVLRRANPSLLIHFGLDIIPRTLAHVSGRAEDPGDRENKECIERRRYEFSC